MAHILYAGYGAGNNTINVTEAVVNSYHDGQREVGLAPIDRRRLQWEVTTADSKPRSQPSSSAPALGSGRCFGCCRNRLSV